MAVTATLRRAAAKALRAGRVQPESEDVRRLRGEAAEFLSDVRARTDQTRTLADMPCLFIADDPPTATLMADLDRAAEAFSLAQPDPDPEAMESALRSARLSWDIAKENARLRVHRGTGPGAAALTLEQRGALVLARSLAVEGTPPLKVVNLLRDTGLNITFPFPVPVEA